MASFKSSSKPMKTQLAEVRPAIKSALETPGTKLRLQGSGSQPGRAAGRERDLTGAMRNLRVTDYA
jgi:hypothetical protein